MKSILIDEYQVISFIWNLIKNEIDKSGDFEQYILTGCVTDKLTNNQLIGGINEKHTGTGRIIRKMMRTMSLYESGESNGKESISELIKGFFNPCKCTLTINDYAYLLYCGGWRSKVKKEILR